MWRARLLRFGLLLLLCTVWGPAGTPALAAGRGSTVAAAPPPHSTVVVIGDSVPANLDQGLSERFRDVLGWTTRDLARKGCSVFGQQLAWPDGTGKRTYEWCEDIRSFETAALADAPEVVVWWDRLALFHYFTGPEDEGGEFVYAGSDRFWELRLADLDALATEIVASGALLVLVRTEPMGIGVERPCPTWHDSRQCWDCLRFRTKHYTDITRPWNRAMNAWANDHPDQAVIVNITDDICRVNESPCDDRIRGIPARDDGSHYADAGARKVVRVLVREIRTALGALP